jgi:OOP family OmpA-OmpF porin
MRLLPALPCPQSLPAAALATLLATAAGHPVDARAQPSASVAGRVVVSGAVPDEATRAAILARVREIYGAERVVDQLGIDKLVAPPNWVQQVQRVLAPDLRQVTQGQLHISGNVVELSGRIDSETVRQQLVEQVVARLNNPTYTVRDGLSVNAPTQQMLDAAVARRTIAFEPGNATLTPAGMQVLDELLPLLRRLAGRRFEVVGHTDDRGVRASNLVLSAARAESVKAYLVNQGIPAADIQTSGAGPDQPVADNLTTQGRSRNRRIEFRVLA